MARNRIILVALIVAGIAQAAPPGNVVCINAADYQRLRQHYDNLFALYDLATVTQRFIDVSNEASDLKDQLKVCRDSSGEKGQQDCDSLTSHSDAKMRERQSVQNRLVIAVDMDEYLPALKLRLEQRQCEK
jgi:hypothetical protein